MKNLRNIIETVRAAKETAPSYETHELAEHFEEFLTLYQDKDSFDTNPDYRSKLTRSYKQVWNGLEKLALSFGLSIDQIRAYFENQSNFTPQQWANIQSVKQEVDSQMKEDETPTLSPSKKLKKLKHKSLKMRI